MLSGGCVRVCGGEGADESVGADESGERVGDFRGDEGRGRIFGRRIGARGVSAFAAAAGLSKDRVGRALGWLSGF